MDLITCIYCKQDRERPTRGEHVMLKALGGQVTITDVCGGAEGCNQKLGDTIDRELTRNSLVALPRLFDERGPKHEQHVFYFREDHGVWLDVVAQVGRGTLIVPPQVYLHRDATVFVASDGFDDEARRMLSSSVDPLLDEIGRPYLKDNEYYAPPRIVFHPSRRTFIARARSEADYAHFVQTLRSKPPGRTTGASGVSRVVLTGNSRYGIQLAVRVNEAPRCAAKMAFNFMCHHLGADVALRPEFDSVRDYITGENVAPVVSVVGDDGEAGLTVDTRHVANWMNPDVPANPFKLLRSGHYILLDAHRGQIFAEVGLYGGLQRFQMVLGSAPPSLVIGGLLPALFMTPVGGGGDRVLAGWDLLRTLSDTGLIENAVGGTTTTPEATAPSGPHAIP